VILVLIPIITEKTLGFTIATAQSKGSCTGCTFSVTYELSSGRWVHLPSYEGNVLNWGTEGPPPVGGSELGSVTLKATTPVGVQTITMGFNNPSIGPNTCSAIVTPTGRGITAECHIGSGSYAAVVYVINYNLAKNPTKPAVTESPKPAKNATSTTASSIGSERLLTVTTKVSGGIKKPSDFTITVSGKNPSPKSFSGSSSGTSVTLNAGKYKVSGSGPTGYTTKYSSGCSGTASGGVPIKCTVSSTYSKSGGGSGTSNSTSTTH
jgi:hypothetical protein